MTLTVRYGDPASVGTDPNRLSTAGPLERAWEICDRLALACDVVSQKTSNEACVNVDQLFFMSKFNSLVKLEEAKWILVGPL